MTVVINLAWWTILTILAVAIIVTAAASVLIASRLARILVLLRELNGTFGQFQSNLRGISTVIRSKEEAIQASREAEETNAERLLLGE